VTRVLLVQADTDDRQMYADYLAWHGFEVVTVSRTEEAVPLIASCSVLVTGLMVPGTMFPIALIEGAKHGEWGKSVPVIVVTASILFPLHNAAEAAGADRILQKPCYPGDLLKSVQAVLHRSTGPVAR
jgi:DNA-binding response OmpR family regulator